MYKPDIYIYISKLTSYANTRNEECTVSKMMKKKKNILCTRKLAYMYVCAKEN